jgi:uncharacterized protein
MGLLKLILACILVYIGFVFYIYLIQREMIYFPQQNAPSPAEAGVPEMDLISFRTRDHLSLSAWYAPPKEVNAPTIIYFHGNGGHIGNRAPLIKPYLDEGFGVLLVTYRGYSGNPGIPTEEGLYNDARGAIQFVLEQQENPCIILYGNSLGAAVAVQMAIESEYPLTGLILQSPFTSVPDLARYHYFYLPVSGLVQDVYDSLSKCKKISAPVLVIQGTADTIIPKKFGRKLYDAIQQPKEIYEAHGKGHNDLFEPERVIGFIRSLSCRKKSSESDSPQTRGP